MNKIRILHLIKSLGRGGAEMLLPETLRVHDQTKFEFYYIYFLPWKDQVVQEIKEAGGVVTCMPASNNLQILMKANAVIRFCKVHHIDIIHCHLPWAGFLGRLVHKKTKIPVIYSEHNKQERYHILTRKINQFTFNWQSRAIAVSADVAESINSNIRPAVPIEVILNGVNVEKFRRDIAAGAIVKREQDIPADAVVIGTIAVFRFQKRLVEWLEVMKVLCEKFPNVYGLIVGDGPLKGEIISKRAALGLEKRVMMPGLQTDVKPWMSAIDVYMMTSVFEGLPVALLEAMSMECAIATTNAGGIKELIRNETDGLLVDLDNWKQLPDIVERLLETPARTRFAMHARKRVVDSFSLDRMVKKLEEIYLTQR